MARTPGHILPTMANSAPVQRMEMETFARRLHQVMLEKKISQSDLARRMWGSTTDSRGFNVAKNRERVCIWLKGKSYPDQINLQRLADTLGMKIEELAPDMVAGAVERENPEVQFTMAAGHSDKVYLRVNKLVPMALAAKIVTLLSEG